MKILGVPNLPEAPPSTLSSPPLSTPGQPVDPLFTSLAGGAASTALVLRRGSLRALNSAFLSFCALLSALRAAAVEAAMLGVTSRPTR